MIIVRLLGGLGNQMFQYAAGRNLALTNNTELKLDITGYEKQTGITLRKYMLHVFNIQEKLASKSEINKLKKNSLIWKFVRKINPYFKNNSYIEEKCFHFDPNILDMSDNIYLNGSWQSEKYFSDISDIIRREFTFKNNLNKINNQILTTINGVNSVSLHIRRGDYVSNPVASQILGVLSLDYYNNALAFITKKVKDAQVFVFSDDIVWAKKNLKTTLPISFIDHHKENMVPHEDLMLMSCCKHHIIANSSFGWWGAWLSDNPQKIVVAPKRWFNNPNLNTKDLIPQDWITL
jgi:hypothetical protein